MAELVPAEYVDRDGRYRGVDVGSAPLGNAQHVEQRRQPGTETPLIATMPTCMADLVVNLSFAPLARAGPPQ